GTGDDRGLPCRGELDAVTAQNDGRLRRRCSGAAATAAEAAESSETAAATAHTHAPEVTLANDRVPAGLELAGFDTAQDSDVVYDVGIRTAGERAVDVLDRGGPPARTAEIIVAPFALHLREMHRLGIDEFHAFHGVIGARREAGEHQVGKRPGLATVVVLVIHESRVLHVVEEVVVLVAADRVIRNFGVRRAAGVSDLFRSPGVADVRGFADE